VAEQLAQWLVVVTLPLAQMFRLTTLHVWQMDLPKQGDTPLCHWYAYRK